MLNRAGIETEIAKLKPLMANEDKIVARMAYSMALALRAVIDGKPSKGLGDSLLESVDINATLAKKGI